MLEEASVLDNGLHSGIFLRAAKLVAKYMESWMLYIVLGYVFHIFLSNYLRLHTMRLLARDHFSVTYENVFIRLYLFGTLLAFSARPLKPLLLYLLNAKHAEAHDEAHAAHAGKIVIDISIFLFVFRVIVFVRACVRSYELTMFLRRNRNAFLA